MIKTYLNELQAKGQISQDENLSYLEKSLKSTNIDSHDLKCLKNFENFFFSHFSKCKACRGLELIISLNEGYCYECDTFLSTKGA